MSKIPDFDMLIQSICVCLQEIQNNIYILFRGEEAKLDAGDENIREWQQNIQEFNTGR